MSPLAERSSVDAVPARLLILTISLLLVCAAPAAAALGDEVAAGHQLAGQLQAGTTSCDRLSDDDAEHLGEYAMERMLGSRAAHAAMNERMTAMLGSDRTERMHQLVGRRYAGCASAGMMGGVGTMMGSRDLAWMRDGSWQHMSRGDWQHLGAAWMGPGMMGDDDWSAGTVIALVAGIALATAIVAFIAGRRRSARRAATPR
jgi:hypothetical protein